jgi:hypothetical protein
VQCLEELSQSNVNNLNRVRHEASRHFRKEKKGYLKIKTDELETNRKIENISDFKNGYQPRINIVKDEKSDWVTDFHSILATWRKHFSQLLSVYGVHEVRHSEIHKVEPVVPEHSALAVEMAIGKLKKKQIARYSSNPSKNDKNRE